MHDDNSARHWIIESQITTKLGCNNTVTWKGRPEMMQIDGDSRSIQGTECTVKSHSLDDPATISTRVREAIGDYATTLIPLIAAAYGPESLQQAWREFMSGRKTRFTGDHPHGEIFFSWFFHDWSPAPKRGNTVADPSLHGIPPTRAFLNRHSGDLNPLLRQYLEACLETPFGFLHISECRPGTGFRARDLLGGAQIEVIDGIASNSLQAGEIIFARVPLIDGIRVMDAIAPVSFPPSFHGHFSKPQLGARSRKRSERGLRKLYFDLLKLHLGGRLPEIRDSGGNVIDGPAAYLGGGVAAYPAEVIFGPAQEPDGPKSSST
jgi:hypothetical protein